MSVKDYFDQHTDQRLLVKYVLLGIGGGVLTYAAAYVASGTLPVEYVVLATTLVSYCNEKFKLLSPLEPWPVLGAQGKKKK